MTKKSSKSQSGSTTPKEKPVGAMKDVYTELTEGIQSVDVRCEELGVCMSQMQTRLDGLIDMVKDLSQMQTRLDEIGPYLRTLNEQQSAASHRMAMLEDWTRRVDVKHDQQIQVLLDRVIEMAMVNQGKPAAAAIHRTKSDNLFSNKYSWGAVSEQTEDEWPPPGCDSQELKG